MKSLAWALVALVLGASAAPAAMIAVDSRAALCLERLAADFQARGGPAMDPFAASPQALKAQIQSIAPFALAIALDRTLVQELLDQGTALEVRELPSSPLCLWSPQELGSHPGRLRDPDAIVAMADPHQDPMGQPAERWLRDQGLWEMLQQQGRLRLRPTALEAAEVAASGGADLVLAPGFLFWNAGGSLTTLPLEGASTFGVLLDQGAGAREFLDYLASPEALDLWRSCGFGRR